MTGTPLSPQDADHLLAEGLEQMREGDKAQGLAMIRKAPFAAKNLQDRVRLSMLAAQSDPDAIDHVKNAKDHQERSEHTEAQSEYYYCNSIYPFHKDYCLLYGEALFTNGKFMDAEFYIRNAWILGAPGEKCRLLIEKSMSSQDIPRSQIKDMAAVFLDKRMVEGMAKPCADIQTLRAYCDILLGDPHYGIDFLVKAQRIGWDAKRLLTFFIKSPEFRYKNLNLFLVLKSRVQGGLV